MLPSRHAFAVVGLATKGVGLSQQAGSIEPFGLLLLLPLLHLVLPTPPLHTYHQRIQSTRLPELAVIQCQSLFSPCPGLVALL